MQKPLIILPCSKDKRPNAAMAKDLYLGKGYLPLLDKSYATLQCDYDLAIMSAKYGLVHAFQVIEPYEQKLSEDSLPQLVKQKARSANALIKSLAPSKIIACLPKLYLTALREMLNEANSDIELNTPAKGAGIGSQRGFLVEELKQLAPKYIDIHFFGNKTKGKPQPCAMLRFTKGDCFRPWLKNTVNEKGIHPTYGRQVEIAHLRNTRSGPKMICTNGHDWSSINVQFGLPSELSAFIRQFIDENVDVYGTSTNKPVFYFSELEKLYGESLQLAG